jgi:hypothetical protein
VRGTDLWKKNWFPYLKETAVSLRKRHRFYARPEPVFVCCKPVTGTDTRSGRPLPRAVDCWSLVVLALCQRTPYTWPQRRARWMKPRSLWLSFKRQMKKPGCVSSRSRPCSVPALPSSSMLHPVLVSKVVLISIATMIAGRINEVDSTGWTPLHWAASRGRVGC